MSNNNNNDDDVGAPPPPTLQRNESGASATSHMSSGVASIFGNPMDKVYRAFPTTGKYYTTAA